MITINNSTGINEIVVDCGRVDGNIVRAARKSCDGKSLSSRQTPDLAWELNYEKDKRKN